MAKVMTADTIEAWTDTKRANDEHGVVVFPYGKRWTVRIHSNDTETFKHEVNYAGRLYRSFDYKWQAETFANNLRKHLNSQDK
jgi:hypothetical protein